MKLTLHLLLLFTISLGFSQTQNLPIDTSISIITFGPGPHLNDAFGHNAIRVKNRFKDISYDFGRYDFEDANFYLNFVQGKLNYLQGKSKHSSIINYYKSQNRSIKEQTLDLSQSQKQNLYNYLENNYKKNKGAYLYDFFYDNCATKIRDIVAANLDDNLQLNLPNTYKEQTFRQLIDSHVYWNTWGSFGIDLALGSVIDRKATPEEQLFLPININRFFEVATFKDTDKKIVKNSKTVFNNNEETNPSNLLLSPLVIILTLSIVIIFITYNDYKNNKRTKALDLCLFITTGIIGIILVLLWFATDHTGTAYNYNVLWSFPLSLFCVPQLLKNTPKRWFIAYLKFLLVMLCLMVLHWTVGVQRFAPTLAPLLIALALRYVFVLKHYNTSK